jgi:hypothetical protein
MWWEHLYEDMWDIHVSITALSMLAVQNTMPNSTQLQCDKTPTKGMKLLCLPNSFAPYDVDKALLHVLPTSSHLP